ncbi:MAG TPA: LLM class F420-dependent oxidoreductase [Acidimicrobiales bacterium]
MKLGLHVPDFTWEGGATTLGEDLARVAATAEAAGFDRISVMDHVFQMVRRGGPEKEMLESTTTLGFLAGRTSRLKLLALVSGVVYREPGMLAKSVTTLDVLSGGRAMLGIGAAWYEEEAAGLGLPFPPLSERFERLEEALQICLQMWSEEDTPFKGEHYELTRTLNHPQSLSRPHPPILIGGSGEKKTLRLVAKYGDACNLFPGPDLAHKLEVLQQHCADEGRDYDEIEKTLLFTFDLGTNGENLNEIIDQLAEFAAMGFTIAHGSVVHVGTIRPLELLGEHVVAQVAAF